MEPISISIIITVIFAGLCAYIFNIATKQTPFEEVILKLIIF